MTTTWATLPAAVSAMVQRVPPNTDYKWTMVPFVLAAVCWVGLRRARGAEL